MFSDMLQLAMVVGVYGVLLCVFRHVATSGGCGCIWSVAVCFRLVATSGGCGCIWSVAVCFQTCCN